MCCQRTFGEVAEIAFSYWAVTVWDLVCESSVEPPAALKFWEMLIATYTKTYIKQTFFLAILCYAKQ